MLSKLFSSISLKWRAACVMTLLALCVLLLSSLVQRHYARADLRQAIADQQAALVTRVAGELDAKLDTALQMLQRTAEAMPAQALEAANTPAAIREHFRARRALFVVFDDIYVYSPQGRVLGNFEIFANTDFSVADRPHFKYALATGKPVISEPFIGRVLGEPIVQVTVPVLDRNGRVIAVLGGILRLYRKNFLADLGGAKVGRSGYFVILSKGPAPVYVVHPDRKKIMQPRPPANTPEVSRALAGDEAPAEGVAVGGARMLYAFRSLRQVDWLLVAAVPTEEVFAPLVRAEERLAVIGTVLALLMLPLFWWISWIFLGPLTALRDKMERMRAGAVGNSEPDPVLARRGDEIGALARSFDRLFAERRAAERALSLARERLATILNNLPVVVAHLDPQERYLFVNDRFTQWHGVPVAEAIGRTPREVLGERAYESIGPKHQMVLTGSRVQYRRQIMLDGREGWIDVILLPDFGADDTLTGFYVVATDVTDRKLGEDRQRAFSEELAARVEERTRELQESNRELETFVYSVAHNFRAPLRAINGYGALVAEDAAGLAEEKRELLKRMRDSSTQLARLIDGLLRLANVRKLPLQPQTVDVSALARTLLEGLAAGEPQRRLRAEIEPGLTAHGDPELLRQVLAELLGNAWKFGAFRHILEIGVGAVREAGEAGANDEGREGREGHEGHEGHEGREGREGREGHESGFYVRDNGCGFDAALADKLFVPFSRLHGVEDFPGNGIGLALVQRIVQRHGGSVRAQGSPDLGACLIFTLGPRAGQPPPAG
ncbi:MAG: histidine kinase [Betaproteobacteria bacterium]|nr:histidine kinase [Betaproteobacteria bacterium]